jgi:hypothetical protein
MTLRTARIEIEKPCQQDWNAMPPVAGGIYCSRCTKVVTDFTSMSDEALIEFLSRKHSGEICGKFSKGQLDKVYQLPAQGSQPSYTGLKLLMAGLLGLPFYSGAQSASSQKQTQEIHHKKTSLNSELHKKIIRGRIFDRANHKGVHASIKLYTDNSEENILSVITTDSSGHYQLTLPKTGLNKFFRIVFISENYQERFIVVDRDKVPAYLEVSLLYTPTVEVVTTYIEYPAQEVVGGMSIERVHSYGGISPQMITTKRAPFYKRIWYKLRYFAKKTFGKKD